MSFLLLDLRNKAEVDYVVTQTEDLLVVLRFGDSSQSDVMRLDDTLMKCATPVSRMATIYAVAPETVPEYMEYFDISVLPALLFFYNAQHMKCDYGTPDHTKWVGPFVRKQDFVDLVEAFYRGAMHGKYIVDCPIDRARIPSYDMLYLDY